MGNLEQDFLINEEFVSSIKQENLIKRKSKKSYKDTVKTILKIEKKYIQNLILDGYPMQGVIRLLVTKYPEIKNASDILIRTYLVEFVLDGLKVKEFRRKELEKRKIKQFYKDVIAILED